MIPKVGGDSLLLVSDLSVSFLSSIVFGLLPVCRNLKAGFSLGSPVQYIVLGIVGALWRLGTLLLLSLRRFLLVPLILMPMLLLLMLSSPLTRLIGEFLIVCLAVLACLPGFVMLFV